MNHASCSISMKVPNMDYMREFMKYDTDQSGALGFDEFLAMQPPDIRRAHSDEEIRTWFDAADTDGNGSIDPNEFFAMKGLPTDIAPQRRAAAAAPAAAPRGPTMNDLREFMAKDTDFSMTIDWDEFLAMQPADIRGKYSDAEIRTWFESADTDGNGSIDANEYFELKGRLQS